MTYPHEDFIAIHPHEECMSRHAVVVAAGGATLPSHVEATGESINVLLN